MSALGSGLDPERAFVGAMLYLGVGAVVDLLRLVQLSDLKDPQLRVVVDLVRTLAEEGVPPDVAAVSAAAQRTGAVRGGHRRVVLDQLLIALYTEVPTPASAVYYRNAVLDRALRRRAVQMCTRVAQAANEASPDETSTADLMGLMATEYAAAVAAAERLQEARQESKLSAALA